MVKTYILDTNVLMSTQGKVLHGFDDNTVIITHTTLEELDKFKMAPGERGFQAREAIRAIKEVIENKKADEEIASGITLDNKGTFRITTNNLSAQMPKGWDLNNPDNCILCTCKTLTEEERTKKTKNPVILITNDVSLAIKAETLGLTVQEYKNDIAISDEEEYTGRTEIAISDTSMNKLYKDKVVSKLNKRESAGINLHERQYAVVKSTSGSSALIYNHDGGLHLVENPDKEIYGIKPKNVGQKFALQALLAPPEEIPLVILKGAAGTGKTLLSLAAGLEKTYEWNKEDASYNSIVITRSNTLSDEDIGFLPGSLEDKMGPLVSPFMDNLKFLLSRSAKGEERREVNMQIEDMLETGIIEIISLAYIRGRSLNNTFLIVDEFQNATRLQALSIVTRMGIGSKLVVLGDPNQVDNPKLDRKNNGLVYLSEKFKDSPLCAEVTFDDSESVRSPLAKEAIYRLN